MSLWRGLPRIAFPAALAALATLQASRWGLHPAAAGALGAATSLPLLAARRAPVAATAVSIAATGTFTFLGYGQGRLGWPWPVSGCAALLVLLYLLAADRGWRVAGAAAALLAAGALAPAAWTVPLPPGVLLLAGAAAGVVVWAGENVRARRLAQRRLREESARSAVREERTRIARELHDVVAHHLSLIAIEAQAAQHRPGDQTGAFEVVHGLARDGLTEMRAMLRALRDVDSGAPRSPQPGLADLESLVAAARRSGLAVRLGVHGPVLAAPPGVQLAAYRIVQEALSNCARHAPGAQARVELRARDGVLNVRVTDDGPHGPPAEPGLGLLGMRERAPALGAALHAGPRAQGGFAVETDLPTSPEVPS